MLLLSDSFFSYIYKTIERVNTAHPHAAWPRRMPNRAQTQLLTSHFAR